MSNKQTAVEFLESRIKVLIPDDIGSQLMFKSNVTKAKKMETEQFKQFSLYEHKETITSTDTKVSTSFLDNVPDIRKIVEKSEIPINLEISDEEIIKAAEDQATFAPSFIRGAQWYREQLNKK